MFQREQCPTFATFDENVHQPGTNESCENSAEFPVRYDDQISRINVCKFEIFLKKIKPNNPCDIYSRSGITVNVP